MAILTVIQPTLAGVSDALVSAAGGGDSFPNDGYTVFRVNNASGGALTVRFDAPGALAPDQAASFDADVQVSVPAGASRIIGPFTDKARFNDANGRVNVTYPGGVTSLTVGAIRVY